MARRLNLRQRQSSLGPAAELGEFFPSEPFPLEQLSQGLQTGRRVAPRTVEPSERPDGLKAVGLFGQVVTVPDDDFIKETRANTEQKKQELATHIQSNPRDPLLPKMISDFQTGKQVALLNEDKLKINKAQVEKFQKLIGGKDHNDHDFLEIERALRDYAQARNADPSNVPDLNLEPLIARIPKKTERNKIINENLGKIVKTEAFSSADLKAARNATIQDVGGERVLVSVTGQGVGTNRVTTALEEVFNQPGFLQDVRRQAETEAEHSGDFEGVDARVQEILEGHKDRAIATFVGTDLSQSIKRLPQKGLSSSGGGVSSERFNFTRDVVAGKKIRVPLVFPGMSATIIKTTSRDDIIIAKRSGSNPSINVSDGRKGSNNTIKFRSIRFIRDEEGEWHLLGEVPANQKVWLPKGIRIAKNVPGKGAVEVETTKNGYIRPAKPVQITRPWEEIKEEFMAEYDNITIEDILAQFGESEPAEEAPAEQQAPEVTDTKKADLRSKYDY